MIYFIKFHDKDVFLWHYGTKATLTFDTPNTIANFEGQPITYTLT